MKTLSAVLTKARLRRGLPEPEAARLIRVQAELTQQEIAAALGVDQPTVARWESGSRSPRGKVRDRYATLLMKLRTEVLR